MASKVEVLVVEGAVGAPAALLEEVKKSFDSPSLKMVVEEGILSGPGVGPLLGDGLVVAEGFPGWLSLLDPHRCSSVSCWCPPVFKDAYGWSGSISWLDSCDDI